ncbi:MAG: response regulator transcription factor [Actinomycetota bacterium]|nr:response regulator transcription factor [Actinomycetota bacterium]
MVSQDSTSAADLRVVVAEAHHLVRYALVDVLASAGAVVTQATDSESALREIADHGADVLMVNLDLPGIERGHVVAIARDRWPAMAVVALSDGPDHEALLRALDLGASAYLPTTAPAARFVAAAVQAAAAPGAFVADDLMAPRRHARAGPRLTPRESDVLSLAAEGLTVSGISARLYVSEATTRSHLSGIYRKFGVTSRSQAVLAAERLGMLGH